MAASICIKLFFFFQNGVEVFYFFRVAKVFFFSFFLLLYKRQYFLKNVPPHAFVIRSIIYKNPLFFFQSLQAFFSSSGLLSIGSGSSILSRSSRS